MDVWLAAAERQRTHGDLVNLSAGPAQRRRARRRCARRRPRRCDTNQLGYTVALGIPELRDGDRRRRTRTGTASTSTPTTSWSPPARPAASCWRSWPASTSATGWRSPAPAIPCYRNILSALGCEVVELPCGPETRFQPTAQMLADARPAGAGRDRRESRPTRPGR